MHDLDIMVFIAARRLDCLGKARCRCCRDPDMGFIRRNPDRANIVLGHTSAPTQKRQYPFGVSVIVAANVKFEPDRIVKAVAVRFLHSLTACAVIEHFGGNGHFGPVNMHKCGGNILRTHRFEQFCTERTIFVLNLHWSQQRFEQAFMILGSNISSRWRIDPVGIDLRPAQHRFDAFAALIGNDQNCRSLFPCATCAT